jgi:hypothetical protein
MSTSNVSTTMPAVSRAVSSPLAKAMPESPARVAKGEEQQATALHKDIETPKVCVATKLPRDFADGSMSQAMQDGALPPGTSFPSPPVTDGDAQSLDSGRLPPLPALSPSPLVRAAASPDGEEDDDDNRQPQPHGRDKSQPTKHKYRATTADGVEVPSEPQSPRPKKRTALDEVTVTKETIPERKKRRIYDDAADANRIIAAEQRRLTNPTNKHIKAMKKWNYIKVGKGSAQVIPHNTKITALKTRVHGTAAALDPNLNSNRDISGLKNKFDYQRERGATVDESQITAWKGSKWTDESDPNMTWFQIPVSQKTLALSGRMVPVSEIIAKSINFPEFNFVETVMVKHPKTGKEVPGFHKITYEKLSAEQASERMSAMVNQAKAEAAQRKKDQVAMRKREMGKNSRRCV